VIASLTGTVQSLAQNQCVLDVNGVGYLVSITSRDSLELRQNNKAQLLISMIVREDALLLFGFLHSEQRDLFDLLRSVNGVGPKTALAILSEVQPVDIATAVATEDDKVFSAISGIGPKTAKLIVVTLTGRLKSKVASGSSEKSKADSQIRDSVIMALAGLGISEKDAAAAVDEVSAINPGSSRDVLLKATLAAIGAAKAKR
jgi:Holliday junction DNA helicase RuvA